MTTYIALLRAVNVGGHNIISMGELRDLCEEMGWMDVRTYVQSGNVVFRAKSVTAKAIEDAVERRFGMRPAVVIRTAKEWAAVVAGNPYPDHAAKTPKFLQVAFLAAKPAKSAVDALSEAHGGPEPCTVIGKHAYIYYCNGSAKTKFTNAVIEKKLGTAATARNWNTVLKLHEWSRS